MIDPLGLAALALITVEWLGLGWLSGVTLSEPPGVASWALRLLVGSCLVAVAQLVLALAGVGFASIPLVLLIAGVGAGALRILRSAPKCEAKLMPVSLRERVGWLVLGAILSGSVVRSLLVHEAGWDAYSHWGLRAQAFALAGTIVNAHSEHEYYPPLVPLLEAWLYLHRGSVSIDLGKTVWGVIGSAFAICLGWHLRLSLRSPWLAPYFSAGIVLGTTALLESFWTGQADLALTTYLSLATLALLQWQRAADRVWLIQAAVFGAAAALTKFEGLPRAGVVVAALAVLGVVSRDRYLWRPALVLGIASVLGSTLWTAFELTHGIAANGEHVGGLQLMALGDVVLALIAVFGGVRTGGGLLVAALAWIVAGPRIVMGPLRLVTLVVVGQLVATLIAFLLSATSPDLEVRTSATRLFEQFLPLALFVGAVGLSEVHL